MSYKQRTAEKVRSYNRVKKNQLDAQLILSIFRQPLHVSGVSRPIIRRYNRMYTTVGTYYSFSMSVCCPGCIGTCRGRRNILRIRCASSWFLLHAFFWIIPRRLNVVCRRFGTLCSIFIGRWLCEDAGELPRRKHTTFRTRRKFEIKKLVFLDTVILRFTINKTCNEDLQF